MHPEFVFLLLITFATAVALVARPISMPSTVALVVAGLVFGPRRLVQPPRRTKEILYTLILPGQMIFGAE